MRPLAHSLRAVPIAIVILLALACAWPALADPSGPWKPELTHRPRLLWEAAEWDTILDRLDREPYATLYARVRSRAGASPRPMPEYYDAGREYGNANIAKDAAFVWAVEGDASAAEKAALILEDLALDFTYEGGIPGLYELLDDDIHVAEAMQGYCVAFDILAGTNYLDPGREQAIRDRLEQMLVNCWQFFLVDWYIVRQEFSNNNHFTKLAAAFGTAAITLNDSQYASEWINHAMAWGTKKLFALTTPGEGTFAEGPSYQVYSADNHLPFFLQYDLFTGGESGWFEQRHCLLTGYNCWYEDVFVVNPLDDDRMHTLARWTVDIRLPDGRCPPFDDSFMIGNLNGLLAGAWGDGEMAWDWLRAPGAPHYSRYISDNTPDMICTFDDSIVPTPPARGPGIVLPESGFAIFRTGWDEGATYAMFIAERGQSRTMVPGHEHADTLSFMLWADDTFLAIDPGYIRYEMRDEVRFGVDHNVIAIDGEGPPAPNLLGIGGVDGELTAWDLSGTPEYAVGITNYSRTDWARAFFFYGGFAVVGDLLESNTVHDYEFLLHGHGGGDTGGDFTLLESGARWEIDGMGLDFTITGTGEIAHSHYLDHHGWHWNQDITHEVYSGQIVSHDAGYVAALVPDQDDPPQIARLELGVGAGGLSIRTGGFTDYVVADDGSGNAVLPTVPPIRARSAVTWVRPAENRALVIGESLYVDGRRIAHQTGGTSMEVRWDDGLVELVPDTAAGNALLVETTNPATSVTGSCVTGWSFDAGFTRIEINGSCTVRVEYDPTGDDDDDDNDSGDDDSGDDDDDDSGGCGSASPLSLLY